MRNQNQFLPFKSSWGTIVKYLQCQIVDKVNQRWKIEGKWELENIFEVFHTACSNVILERSGHSFDFSRYACESESEICEIKLKIVNFLLANVYWFFEVKISKSYLYIYKNFIIIKHQRVNGAKKIHQKNPENFILQHTATLILGKDQLISFSLCSLSVSELYTIFR